MTNPGDNIFHPDTGCNAQYENALVWSCDGGCGATLSFEREDRPGYFLACVSELKDRGWRIWRIR